MKLKWTNADAKRAEKMDWAFTGNRIIAQYGGRFFANQKWENKQQADAMAVVWVVNANLFFHETSTAYKTCRKAVLLCCLGGEPK